MEFSDVLSTFSVIFIFVLLGGSKGAVAASMATLPVVLGRVYNSPELTNWRELILSAALMMVLLSMLLESAWVSALRGRLLD